MALVSSSPRARLSSSDSRAIRARWATLSATTTAPTSAVTPRICLSRIDMRTSRGAGRRPRGAAASGALLHAVQLVVQRLQADAQHLGGPGLVARGGVERRQDELLLGLV